MSEYSYRTPHGIAVTRTATKAGFRKGLKHLLRDLDRHRGIYFLPDTNIRAVFALGYRLHRPPLEIVSYDRRVEFRPLNIRGENLKQILHAGAASHPHWESNSHGQRRVLRGRLKPLPALFPEEERSKQPSAFSILRALIEEFRGEEDARLGLVGAFGYDLLFQFEPIEKKLPRNGHKDLHLFLCDDI